MSHSSCCDLVGGFAATVFRNAWSRVRRLRAIVYGLLFKVHCINRIAACVVLSPLSRARCLGYIVSGMLYRVHCLKCIVARASLKLLPEITWAVECPWDQNLIRLLVLPPWSGLLFLAGLLIRSRQSGINSLAALLSRSRRA